MDRGKNAFYNSFSNALSQVVAMICGFILPRLILSTFGSSYNGITSSVAQFLSVVSLLHAGVGGATRASLYKSLANKDTKQISATIKATELFMRKIALIFFAMVVIFSVVYPCIVKNEFSYDFAASLVLIISLGTFIQYFFGITYQMLFQADQRQYVIATLNTIAIVLNTLFAVGLIKLGVGIRGVKLGSAIAYSITPITLNILAKRQYHLDRKAKADLTSISQRWDAFFHQLAGFIHGNTDIVLLTLFTNMKEVSVYTVYYLVINGLKNVMNTLTVGVESAFGNILAKDEQDLLKQNVVHYETLLHVVSSIMFGASIVLITPFIQVYTKGVTDVSYIRDTFGYYAVIGEMLFILRSPYEALVNAAGHFKQTKRYAFAEAGINIFISIILVQKLGLVGVAIGTVAAITFRNIAYGLYVSRHLLYRGINVLFRRYVVTGIVIMVTIVLSVILPKPEMISYLNWIVYASEITLVSCVITLAINYIFYKENLIDMIKKILTILKRVIRGRRISV